MTHSREFSLRISQLQQNQKGFSQFIKDFIKFFVGSQNVFPSQPKKGFRSCNKFRKDFAAKFTNFFRSQPQKGFRCCNNFIKLSPSNSRKYFSQNQRQESFCKAKFQNSRSLLKVRQKLRHTRKVSSRKSLRRQIQEFLKLPAT